MHTSNDNYTEVPSCVMSMHMFTVSVWRHFHTAFCRVGKKTKI